MNDDDRDQWIENDEGLYDMWKRSGLSKRKFIRKNRAMIDSLAKAVASGSIRQHALKYGA
jgi:hypothetical protein